MTTEQKIIQAIESVNNGFPTSYINVDDKKIRVSDHGANPSRVDYNTISIVVGNFDQSYQQDRGRVITQWERSNQFYVDSEGNFMEQFSSMSEFLNWFEL